MTAGKELSSSANSSASILSCQKPLYGMRDTHLCIHLYIHNSITMRVLEHLLRHAVRAWAHQPGAMRHIMFEHQVSLHPGFADLYPDTTSVPQATGLLHTCCASCSWPSCLAWPHCAVLPLSFILPKRNALGREANMYSMLN